MLMIIEKDGQAVVREATTRGMTTFDTPYREWAAALRSSERYAGLSVMRVHDALNTPGRIILPWDIPVLKKSIRD